MLEGVTTAPSTSAPAAAPSAPPSAPAASAPAPESTTGGGAPPAPTEAPKPRTLSEGFAQAFAAEAKPAAEPIPAASSAGPEETAAETSQEPDASTPATAKKPQFIPYDRHEKIIANAREKARAEVMAEVEKTVGWARQFKPEQVSAAVELAQQLARDPVGFLHTMAREVSQDPGLRQQLVARRQANAGPPPPDMETADGKHKFYGAEAQQKLINYHVNRAVAQLLERIGPIEKMTARQVEGERELAISEAAGAKRTEMESRPLFKEHIAEIIAEMERDGRLGVEGAYNRVVVPKLDASNKTREAEIRKSERDAVIEEMRRKAGAGSFSPGSGAPPALGSAPLKPTREGFMEGFRRVWNAQGGKL